MAACVARHFETWRQQTETLETYSHTRCTSSPPSGPPRTRPPAKAQRTPIWLHTYLTHPYSHSFFPLWRTVFKVASFWNAASQFRRCLAHWSAGLYVSSICWTLRRPFFFSWFFFFFIYKNNTKHFLSSESTVNRTYRRCFLHTLLPCRSWWI